MARRGKKRKPGQRYVSNGNIKQPSAAQRHKTAQQLVDLEKAVVLDQPHRRGRDQDQLLESALGRLVVRHKLPREIYDAAVEWGTTTRRWLAIKGVPLEIHTRGASGDPPTEDTINRWGKELQRVEKALKKISVRGFEAVRTLTISEREIVLEEELPDRCKWPPDVVMVLVELAGLTGNLRCYPQPFSPNG